MFYNFVKIKSTTQNNFWIYVNLQFILVQKLTFLIRLHWILWSPRYEKNTNKIIKLAEDFSFEVSNNTSQNGVTHTFYAVHMQILQ